MAAGHARFQALTGQEDQSLTLSARHRQGETRSQREQDRGGLRVREEGQSLSPEGVTQVA